MFQIHYTSLTVTIIMSHLQQLILVFTLSSSCSYAKLVQVGTIFFFFLNFICKSPIKYNLVLKGVLELPLLACQGSGFTFKY